MIHNITNLYYCLFVYLIINYCSLSIVSKSPLSIVSRKEEPINISGSFWSNGLLDFWKQLTMNFWKQLTMDFDEKKIEQF